ncbi:MAG TPA: hypothetical protein VMU77_07915 [Acidimicrobiales bacterium]|nr:hypothetical protein [Acidimicrobiales bacterium]
MTKKTTEDDQITVEVASSEEIATSTSQSFSTGDERDPGGS